MASKWVAICGERGVKICEWHNLAYSDHPKSPRDPQVQAKMDQLMAEIRELDRAANLAYIEEHPND